MTRGALIAVVLLAACGGDDDPFDGTPGTFTVAGVIRYEDKPSLDDGSLGAIEPKPARGIEVAAIADDDDATLATGITGDDGTYSLTFDGTTGEPMHILAVAASTLPVRPITVTHVDPATGQAGPIHGFGGPTFSAGVDTTVDVLITVESGEAGAFNIFDTLVGVMDRIPSAFGGASPMPLTALWQVDSDDGTYYLDIVREMHLLGAASDDDGFDDAVIIHEAGHYIEDVIGRSDSPGGSHDGSPTDPRLAWSEGFATYFAMAVRDVPFYVDSNADGGWSYNGDVTVTQAPGSQMTQQVSEDMVTEILWDLGDAGGSDDDPHAGVHDLVLALQPYLDAATLRVIPQSGGVDLVDSLDGWFISYGLASCSAMRNIVNTMRTFPYDYGGAGGSCP